MVISLVSLAILIIWETKLFKSLKFTKIVPGPLVAVVTGVVLATVFQGIPSLMVISEHMVNIPRSSSVNGFFENFTLPDFTALANPKVYITAIIIALVASLETLLSVEAADKLDSLKRVTPTNRELKAQGVGNIIAGFIGGLPVTQVIVRSSANSQSGGKTKASTILHGILMLVCVITIPFLLNKIPYGVLAAILFVVGYKLAKPALFIKMYKQGLGQFIPFLVTVVGIIFSNLLIGIALGLVVAIFIILRNNFKVPYLKKNEKSDGKGVLRVILSEDVTFLNKASIQKLLADIPDDSQVIVDARANRFIHHDVIEIIEDFQISAVARNIEVEVRDLFTDKIYEPKQQFELTNIKE
ncbi:MAG: MFS superfamily sulfate permease-like transporter [Crocinitomicaceae bacterium]